MSGAKPLGGPGNSCSKGSSSPGRQPEQRAAWRWAPHSSRHPQHRENWAQLGSEQMLNNRRWEKALATGVVSPPVLQDPFHTWISPELFH